MSKKTVTLIWTKSEIDLMCVCMSRYLPKQPLRVSATMEKYNCPLCHKPVAKYVNRYCNECGQSLDWEAKHDWDNNCLSRINL